MNYIFMESFYCNWPRRTYIQTPPIKINDIINPNYKFYKILEIEINSNQKIIKKAYIKKVLESHPDKGGNIEEFRKVQEAYEVLLNYENMK